MLRRLEIDNYRSLRKVCLSLPRFAALVGANAAGKSNFADAVEFLSIVAKSGLSAAVDDKGGYENTCFRRARRAKGAIRFYLDVDGLAYPEAADTNIEFRFQYAFSFRATSGAISTDFVVDRENLEVLCRPGCGGEDDWQALVHYQSTTRGELFVSVEDCPESEDLVLPEDFLRQVLSEAGPATRATELLLTSRLRNLPPFHLLSNYLQRMRIFQVTPPSTRRPASASGSGEMGKHGENLPAVLSYLQREEEVAFQSLLDHLQLAVPTVDRIETDYVETRELGLFLRERGIGRRLYASELSDGTLRTLGLFVPLIDPRYELVVIEEPENSVHPWVTRQFVAACRERADDKQIILTTHSPVLVSQLEPEELYVVERTEGETQIQPVKNVSEEVEDVIEKGVMNLGEYWDSGAMRAVPFQLELFET